MMSFFFSLISHRLEQIWFNHSKQRNWKWEILLHIVLGKTAIRATDTTPPAGLAQFFITRIACPAPLMKNCAVLTEKEVGSTSAKVPSSSHLKYIEGHCDIILCRISHPIFFFFSNFTNLKHT